MTIRAILKLISEVLCSLLAALSQKHTGYIVKNLQNNKITISKNRYAGMYTHHWIIYISCPFFWYPYPVHALHAIQNCPDKSILNFCI